MLRDWHSPGRLSVTHRDYIMLTPEQIDALHKHHEWAIASCERAISKFQTIPKQRRSQQVEANIRYFKNLRQGFRWSKSFIGKKLKGYDNAASAVIQNTDRSA